MKKRILLSMILTAVMLATVLAGCGSGSSAAQKEEPAAATESTQNEAVPAVESTEAATISVAEEEGTEAATGTTAEVITGLANPWSDVASAEEAAKGAGIDSFVQKIPASISDSFLKEHTAAWTALRKPVWNTPQAP